MAARQMQWGFPRFQGKGLLINARVEAILDKKTFRDSVLHRRCVIPARHFYEWSKNKEKYTFQSPKQDGIVVGTIMYGMGACLVGIVLMHFALKRQEL